jgi:hypothetical protein
MKGDFMPKAEADNTTIASDDDPETRDLVAQLLDLIDSFEPIPSPLSAQFRADLLLQKWQSARHLPPALRLIEDWG